MLNNVSLVGRLTKDPEVKIIGEGTAICNFTLACNRPYKDANGEKQADFISCQAWKGQAEFIGSYMKKGNLIAITGAINTRTYDKDDVKHYVTEVNVSSVQSLEKKDDSDQGSIATEDSIKKIWNDEWAKRSVGLDASSKSNLKNELAKKYQVQIDSLQSDLPY